MSQRLVSRSPDLQQLLTEGYEVSIVAGRFLRVDSIPYVTPQKAVALGSLVVELTLGGEATTTPATHVAHWAGAHPCNLNGSPIEAIRHSEGRKELDRGLLVDRSFSNKPAGGYADYHQLVTTYAAIIAGPAEAIDPTVTAKTRRVVPNEETDSPFRYTDTASSKAGIAMITHKLGLAKVAIVGLGGTGSYILDHVAKTPVREIHLFDADRMYQHNAFRTPGAPSLEELATMPLKVDYLRGIYGKMHGGIIAHDVMIDETTIELLSSMEFVFVAIDNGIGKRLLIDTLSEWGIPFIDVGMGLDVRNDSIGGVLRWTLATPDKYDHLSSRIDLADGDGDDPYDTNIQISDLNALNAALAVVRWKKHFGFYHDLEREYHTTYSPDCNLLTSEDCA